MTNYEEYLIFLRDQFYPKDHLVDQLQLAKDFIDNHYEKNLTAGQLATVACYSKFHFLRLFKWAYQCTPHEYLTSVRIAKARQLLKDDLNLNDICFAVGFSSTSSFKMLYKRHTGQTPNAYRQSLKSRPVSRPCPPSPFLQWYKKQFSIQAC